MNVFQIHLKSCIAVGLFLDCHNLMVTSFLLLLSMFSRLYISSLFPNYLQFKKPALHGIPQNFVSAVVPDYYQPGQRVYGVSFPFKLSQVNWLPDILDLLKTIENDESSCCLGLSFRSLWRATQLSLSLFRLHWVRLAHHYTWSSHLSVDK